MPPNNISKKNNKPVPKLGMRIVKTALAMLITLILCDLILGRLILRWSWQESLGISTFAVIAAVITIQRSIVATFRVGIERFLGTLIGVAGGLLFLSVTVWAFSTLPDFLLAFVFYTLITLGTLLVIYLCKIIKFASGSIVCVMVFVGIMFAIGSDNPFTDALWRTVGTLIGVIIAVLVNVLIFPPNPRRCGDEVCCEPAACDDGTVAISCDEEDTDKG